MRKLPEMRELNGVRGGRQPIPCSPPLRGPDAPAPDDLRFHGWDKWLTPVDDQGKTGTCCAQRDTRLIEWALHYHCGVYVQLDALAVYRVAWELSNRRSWPGDRAYGDGLRPNAGIVALTYMGVLPKAAEYYPINAAAEVLRRELADQPILAATCVHPGWYKWHPETGEIESAYWVMNGHAWLLHSMDVGSTGKVLIGGVNSWGTDWGRRGFFYWRHDNFVTCCLAPPAVVRGVGWKLDLLASRKAWEPLVIEGSPTAAGDRA